MLLIFSYSKNGWVVSWKDKNGVTVAKTIQTTLQKSNSKQNKICLFIFLYLIVILVTETSQLLVNFLINTKEIDNTNLTNKITKQWMSKQLRRTALTFDVFHLLIFRSRRTIQISFEILFFNFLLEMLFFLSFIMKSKQYLMIALTCWTKTLVCTCLLI